jgi:hypothetical protein
MRHVWVYLVLYLQSFFIKCSIVLTFIHYRIPRVSVGEAEKSLRTSRHINK